MSFSIVGSSAEFEGSTRLVQNNPGNIRLQTAQLQIKIVVEADVSEDHFIGFVQVSDSNTQINTYGPAEQRWEFSHSVVSDSDAPGNRPWYGTGSDCNLSGFSRRVTARAGSGKYKLGMTDSFGPSVAKRETLRDGSAGPNELTNFFRQQSFTTWLVAVPVGRGSGNWSECTPLWKCSWRYTIDASVDLSAGSGLLSVNTDEPVVNGESPDGLPDEAFSMPTANGNQQLSYYLHGSAQHVIVERDES